MKQRKRIKQWFTFLLVFLLGIQSSIPTQPILAAVTNVVDGHADAYTSKTLNIPVEATWDDVENQDGKRPKEVVVTLVQNGVETAYFLVLNETNSWSGSFVNFPVYDRVGKKITYSVVQRGVADYTTEIVGSVGKDFPDTLLFEKLIIGEINGDETLSDNFAKVDTDKLVINAKLEGFTGKAGEYTFTVGSNLINDTNTFKVNAYVDENGNFTITLDSNVSIMEVGLVQISLDGKLDAVRVQYEAPPVPEAVNANINVGIFDNKGTNIEDTLNNNKELTISGSITPVDVNGNKVEFNPDNATITINGEKVNATINPDGTFHATYTPSKDGEVKVEVNYYLDNGNEAKGEANTTIDTTAPLIGELAGTPQEDGSYVVSGKTEPNTIVSVNGKETISDENGEFSVPLDGVRDKDKIQVEATDAAGNKSQGEVEAALPNTGIRLEIHAGNKWEGGESDKVIDNGSTTTDYSPTFVGKVDAEGYVNIMIIGPNGKIQHEQAPIINGEFVFVADTSKYGFDGEGNYKFEFVLDRDNSIKSSANLNIVSEPAKEITFDSLVITDINGDDTRDDNYALVGSSKLTIKGKLEGWNGEAGEYTFGLASDVIGDVIEIEVKAYVDSEGNFTIKDLDTTLETDAFGEIFVNFNGKYDSVNVELDESIATATYNARSRSLLAATPKKARFLVSEVTALEGFTIINHHIPEQINVIGTKVWDDHENNDGKRLEQTTVQLLKNGTVVEEKTLFSSDILPQSRYEFSFTGLPKYENGKEIQYTLQEAPIDGYTSTITGNATDGYVLTSTHELEKVTVQGTKIWEDGKNQDGKRPSAITIDLYGNGKIIDSKTVSGTALDVWNWEFDSVPKYENGTEILYTVMEHSVDGYQSKVNGYEITNQYTLGKINIPVVKQWEDKDNQDGIRPTSILVTLYANGQNTGKTQVLEEGNRWTGNFTDLDEYQNGELVQYTLEEENVEGYVSVISGSAITGYQITNTHTPAVVSIDGSLNWNDKDNQDGKRPEEVVVELQANGVVVETKVVTGTEETWNWSFGELPKYQNGTKVTYTVKQAKVEGYTTTVSGEKEQGFTIDNEYVPVVTDNKEENKGEVPPATDNKEENKGEVAPVTDNKEENKGEVPPVTDNEEEVVEKVEKPSKPSEDSHSTSTNDSSQLGQETDRQPSNSGYITNSNGSSKLEVETENDLASSNNSNYHANSVGGSRLEFGTQDNRYYTNSVGGYRLGTTFNDYQNWVAETGNKNVSYVEYKKWVLEAGNKGISFEEYQSQVPKTSDDTAITIFVVALLSSALVVVKHVRRNRRK